MCLLEVRASRFFRRRGRLPGTGPIPRRDRGRRRCRSGLPSRPAVWASTPAAEASDRQSAPHRVAQAWLCVRACGHVSESPHGPRGRCRPHEGVLLARRCAPVIRVGNEVPDPLADVDPGACARYPAPSRVPNTKDIQRGRTLSPGVGACNSRGRTRGDAQRLEAGDDVACRRVRQAPSGGGPPRRSTRRVRQTGSRPIEQAERVRSGHREAVVLRGRGPFAASYARQMVRLVEDHEVPRGAASRRCTTVAASGCRWSR